GAQVRGRGFIWGLALEPKSLAGAVSGEAFKRGLVLETSGPDSEVLKLLPALTIDKETLEQGLAILEDSLEAVARPI
ncbi:MAG: diaminobutyrate--2-oxoglutarate transaminase, partial [Thermaerobacter sp.]|nr:diaminobutyrate--2-oxoglutarate transaminase [Thermaerobacter sp.]